MMENQLQDPENLRKTMKGLRAVFGVALSAFELADEMGTPDPRRDEMKALQLQAREALMDIDGLNEMELIQKYAEVYAYLSSMEQIAEKSRQPNSFLPGGTIAK